MRRIAVLLILVACVLSADTNLWAEVPPLINYQAQLTDSTGAPVDTTVSLTFTIFENSEGVVSLWSETHPSAVISNGVRLQTKWTRCCES